MERLLIQNKKQNQYTMKKIFLLLAVTSSLIFSSCEGDQGPPGQDGVNILGQVFEANIDFGYDNSTNLYSSGIISIPNNIEVFESDVILVYRFEEQVTVGGQATDVWSPLPQNFFLDNGDIIQYVFNHTFVDVEILIDGNFDLATLGTGFTDDQIFRIAVVPAEFADTNLTLEELMQLDNVEFFGN
jgi:hypothetical protein